METLVGASRHQDLRALRAATFANVTLVTTPSNHFPIATLDCNGSGCHTTTNVTPGAGGFKLGAASISSPTLNAAGHTTVTGGGIACAMCHETAPYLGMIASSATAWGDSRPQAFDKAHPATGDCNGCHTTSPTFMHIRRPSRVSHTPSMS